jgi:hypothetical protein
MPKFSIVVSKKNRLLPVYPLIPIIFIYTTLDSVLSIKTYGSSIYNNTSDIFSKFT